MARQTRTRRPLATAASLAAFRTFSAVRQLRSRQSRSAPDLAAVVKPVEVGTRRSFLRLRGESTKPRSPLSFQGRAERRKGPLRGRLDPALGGRHPPGQFIQSIGALGKVRRQKITIPTCTGTSCSGILPPSWISSLFPLPAGGSPTVRGGPPPLLLSPSPTASTGLPATAMGIAASC
jgi:hypothetical protein